MIQYFRKKTSNIAVDNGSSLNSFQAISVIIGERYGVFTNKKHALNTLKMGPLLRSDVMLS
jgi:hypothetical protein